MVTVASSLEKEREREGSGIGSRETSGTEAYERGFVIDWRCKSSEPEWRCKRCCVFLDETGSKSTRAARLRCRRERPAGRAQLLAKSECIGQMQTPAELVPIPDASEKFRMRSGCFGI